MLSYCLKCRKKTESKNIQAAKTNKARIMPLPKTAVCNNKKHDLLKIKKQADY